MRHFLLVGSNSFLARSVLATSSPHLTFTVCRYDGWRNLDFSQFNGVANFGLNPLYRTQAYDESLDQDLAVARRAADAGRTFVMLSSRKVYGSDATPPTSETVPLMPVDPYGRNKVRTEDALRALLDEKLTILRLANIFGTAPAPGTFFDIALQDLRNKRCITLDTAASTRRDFLPVEDFATAFHRVLTQQVTGVFNLGSGTATSLGDVANALIQGYGDGELVVASDREKDNFLLDSRALVDQIGPYCNANAILARCAHIGKALHENCA